MNRLLELILCSYEIVSAYTVATCKVSEYASLFWCFGIELGNCRVVWSFQVGDEELSCCLVF